MADLTCKQDCQDSFIETSIAKEQNTTTLAICHGALLATTGDYLRNDILYKTNY